MISLKNFVLGVAVFILTLFVGIYGISTLYGEAPAYEVYCPYNLTTIDLCHDFGGTWMNTTQDPYAAKPIPAAPRDPSVIYEAGYCDIQNICQPKFDTAQKAYYKKTFLTALPLGIVLIALGALVFGLEAVGSGLMVGGIAIIVYGTGSYWRFTDDWLKFALSLVGLIIVIWLAYFWNARVAKKSNKKWWKK